VRADGGGHGIAGMRERVAALGGELQAGPRPQGGFRVHARLPLPGPMGPPAGAVP
jgi:signal transduction histidine kinase